MHVYVFVQRKKKHFMQLKIGEAESGKHTLWNVFFFLELYFCTFFSVEVYSNLEDLHLHISLMTPVGLIYTIKI